MEFKAEVRPIKDKIAVPPYFLAFVDIILDEQFRIRAILKEPKTPTSNYQLEFYASLKSDGLYHKFRRAAVNEYERQMQNEN